MFAAGNQIGNYILIKKLGRGGFGEVWLAEKHSQFLVKKVAIKLPHDDQIDFDAIRREAELWEQASGHPNVLPIIDADIYEGQVLIVSEYADGGSLSDKLKSAGKFAVKQAVEMSIGILNGLEFLHHKKIIHRDIKPQNILLQGDTPRLADFGISRAMNTITFSSVIIGTDAYMAPEAFEGKRNVQTDIWSVGVVLYQLLKGSLPFPQEHPSERMFAVLTKPFEPLPGDIPPEIVFIVSKALAKNVEERYWSAKAMCEDLRTAITDPGRIRNTAATSFTTEQEEETVVRTYPNFKETAPPRKEPAPFATPRPRADMQRNYAPPPQYAGQPAPNLFRKTTTDPNNNQKVLAGFCYLGNIFCAIGVVISIISLIANRTDKFAKFHAIQSICFYVSLIAAIIGVNILGGIAAGSNNSPAAGLAGLATLGLYLGGFITLVVCAVRAFQGRIIRLPLIGYLAERWSG